MEVLTEGRRWQAGNENLLGVCLLFLDVVQSIHAMSQIGVGHTSIKKEHTLRAFAQSCRYPTCVYEKERFGHQSYGEYETME